MSDPLRLGIAGLGTVGTGVIKIIRQKAPLLQSRSGRPITISAVSARNRDKDRGVPLKDYAWEDDPVALARRDDVDVFVELMGGSDGPAKAATEAALKAGKHVVTANKAMLAHHGQALAELAEAQGVALRFEAAVAGGIPVIKALTEGLAGNDITRVMGVMNGTCNYILTRMESAGLSYDEAFAEADGLGYLEADPNLDVGGIDAGHKLSLLSAIAFGTQVNFDAVELEGIGCVTIEDIRQAADMGYKIKLLGVCRMTGRGLEQSMTPCLVPATSPLGQLEGGTNMVVIEGDHVGQIVLRGAGAGGGRAPRRGHVDPELGGAFGRLMRQFAGPADRRAGKTHRHVGRQALRHPGGCERLDQVKDIGRARSRNGRHRVHLRFVLQSDRLAHGGHELFGQRQRRCADRVIADQGRDATPHGGWRVGHDTHHGRARAQRVLDRFQRGSGGNGHEDRAPAPQGLKPGQRRAHHLRFHRQQRHRGRWRQRGVQMHAGCLQPVRGIRLDHMHRRSRQPGLQPPLEQRRTHLAAAQQHQPPVRNIAHVHDASPSRFSAA